MGDAKRRGTYSQRVEKAVELSKKEMEEYQKAAAEARKQNNPRAAAKVNLLMAAGLAASMTMPWNKTRR